MRRGFAGGSRADCVAHVAGPRARPAGTP
jgi:hypothetical protein